MDSAGAPARVKRSGSRNTIEQPQQAYTARRLGRSGVICSKLVDLQRGQRKGVIGQVCAAPISPFATVSYCGRSMFHAVRVHGALSWK